MPTATPHVTTIPELRSCVGEWRKAGDQVALVPTMGALHNGHLELIKLARGHARRVVASIFVNPAQFAPHEDFDRYPRALPDDLAKLATVDCDLVWAPSVDEMYPQAFATRIEPQGAALGLESDFRPHFFGGVATVCCKLFCQVGSDFAIFGEKDYQQLAVMRQLVRDLNLPLAIVGAPTIREPDGLAMSSRNRYLSPAERAIAPSLKRTLDSVAARLAAAGPALSPAAADGICSDAATAILAAGFHKIDYVAVRDAGTLAPLAAGPARPLRILAAAWLGKTRLIDNISA